MRSTVGSRRRRTPTIYCTLESVASHLCCCGIYTDVRAFRRLVTFLQKQAVGFYTLKVVAGVGMRRNVSLAYW